MKQPKMKLELRVSKTMDKRSARYPKEASYIRMSASARKFYENKSWKDVYIRIPGTDIKLLVKPALKVDIKGKKASSLRNTGFVTTKTREAIMTALASNRDDVWITDTPEELTIGADPEFVFVEDTGKAAYADTVIAGSGIDKWGAFGSDGPCGELRPQPSDDVSRFILNIEKSFRLARGKALELRWAGGASYSHPDMERTYPIGGHIHLGLPKLPKASQPGAQHMVVKLLDELVALPMVRIDTPYASYRRSVENYGRCGSCRTSNYKIEWRTPSGLWLINKDMAQATLATTKAVAEAAWIEYENKGCNVSYMTSDKFMAKLRKMSNDTLSNIINNNLDKKVTRELINDIANRLKTMPTYGKYKEEIRFFVRTCLGSKPHRDKLRDLRKEWL